MASGGGYDRNQHYGASGSRSPTRPTDYRPHRNDSSDNENPTDSDQMTLDVVDEFKRIVRDRFRQKQQIQPAIVELDVFGIRTRKYPNQCNTERLKRRLPRDVRDSPDTILRLSMAYGDEPEQVTPVIQAKTQKTPSNTNPTNTSLDSIREPLKRVKSNLDSNPPPNLFRAVRSFHERDVARADRLFFGEANHLAPALHKYTFDDARDAVQAIRQTTYESNEMDILLPIIKSYQGTETMCEYLQGLEKKSTKRNESPPPSSGYHNDRQTVKSHSVTNDRHQNTHDSRYSQQPTADSHQAAKRTEPSTTSRFPDNNNQRPSPYPPARDRNQNNDNDSSASYMPMPDHNQYFEKPSTTRVTRDNSPPSRSSADNHRSAPYPSANDSNQNKNNTQGHYYPPTPDPNQYAKSSSSKRNETSSSSTTRFEKDDQHTDSRFASNDRYRDNDNSRASQQSTHDQSSRNASTKPKEPLPPKPYDDGQRKGTRSIISNQNPPRDDDVNPRSPQTPTYDRHQSSNNRYESSSSRSGDDDRREANLYPRLDNINKNDKSQQHFVYKPLHDPYQQSGGSSQASDNRTRDGSSSRPLRHEPNRDD